MGNPKQAENFTYQLELCGHRWWLTWEVTLSSIH
jgi:hypothetical protein